MQAMMASGLALVGQVLPLQLNATFKGDGRDLSEAELIAHCKTFLSSFKVPKRIDFQDRMPMSSFGKILRRDVRKSYWQQQEVKV